MLNGYERVSPDMRQIPEGTVVKLPKDFDISKFNSELIETNESANMLNGNAEMHTSVRTTNIYTIEPEFPKIDHKTPSIELLDTKTTTRKHPELNYKLRAFGAK